MRLPLSPSDAFHWLLDRVVRRDGGPGNVGQLRLRLAAPPDAERVAAAWRALGAQAGILAGRLRVSRLRSGWSAPRGARLEATARAQPLAELALDELRRGVDADRREHARLGVATDSAEPGVVLTWNHRVCDARGAQALLAALPSLACGEPLDEAWWRPGYREPIALPPAAERGRLARRSLDFVKPLREKPVLTPVAGRRPAAPLVVHAEALGADATAACDARMRAAVGRFGETPFLLAALAATLERSFGVGGDLVFPVAVDARAAGESRWLANAHTFLMLRVPEGLASRDLAAAARHLRDEHRRWIAEDGMGALIAALSWMPLVGERLARAELGHGRAGVAASSLVANAGRSTLGPSWFDRAVVGVDHVAAPPGRPGLAVLFHRDARGLGFGVTATAAVAARVAPGEFAARLRAQLVERPLAAT